MKILMICGVYAEENENEVLSYTKGYAEQSANIFQRKLINGIKKNNIGYKIISAPLIGACPMRSTKSVFHGFSEENEEYEYVPFNNIWGIRNISRTCSLKKTIKKYMDSEKEKEFLILVYCPHTPFLEAAIYAKKLRPESKVCLVVPDLPQYMNLNENGRGLYDFFKKYDIKHMGNFIAKVDSFVLLTEPMKEILKTGSRPYIVAEGIIDPENGKRRDSFSKDGVKKILYTGKMNARFGIKELVDSFMEIKDPALRLILCGDGDARAYVEEKSALDSRIEYKGMVTSNKAKEYMQAADVLVNPRPNNEEYTKYSFPSKNIEYLLSGKPVVAHMLSGMPRKYNDFFYVIQGNSTEDMSDAIMKAVSSSEKDCEEKYLRFVKYAKDNLKADKIIKKIIEMNC